MRSSGRRPQRYDDGVERLATNYANWACGIGLKLNSTVACGSRASTLAAKCSCSSQRIERWRPVASASRRKCDAVATVVVPSSKIPASTNGWRARSPPPDVNLPSWRRSAGAAPDGTDECRRDVDRDRSATAATVAMYRCCPPALPTTSGGTGTAHGAGTIEPHYAERIGNDQSARPGRARRSPKDYIIENNDWASVGRDDHVWPGHEVEGHRAERHRRERARLRRTWSPGIYAYNKPQHARQRPAPRGQHDRDRQHRDGCTGPRMRHAVTTRRATNAWFSTVRRRSRGQRRQAAAT